MAQSLQQLKRRIKTASNIAQVARSMEMISASKIKRAQKTVENNKPYAEKITNLAASILKHMDREKFQSPYIDGNGSEKTLLIVISTDKGLCGSLNTNLFKKLLEVENKNLKILALGRRSHLISSRLSGDFITGLNLGTTTPEYSLVFRLIEIINQEFLKGEVGRVQILYNAFSSIFSQVPTLKTILPITITPIGNERETAPPLSPLALRSRAPSLEAQSAPYIFEPAAEKIISDLLPYYIETVLYSSLIEAFTSEQAARMMAMQNAKNNALDIAEYLTLSYNKSRQERITSELLSLNNS